MLAVEESSGDGEEQAQVPYLAMESSSYLASSNSVSGQSASTQSY
jgi:hypothetical protein